ncbi:restriction endonuclease subunit S [Bacteroides ovatus]|nr:restriction endonuclease subunit S [Bacteroides ovatus]
MFSSTDTVLLIHTYLYYVIKAQEQVILKDYHKDGTTVDSIDFDKFKKLIVPLPPLSEQYRIVEEIEHWFALIDQIEQGKTDLQTTIKQIKGKILDLAIHGKLVPQDPNDESAIELLKRINPDFTPCDNRHYTQLPNGWAVCRLDQVADVLDNLRKPINSNERNLRIKGIQIDRLYPYYGATGQVGLIDDYIVDGHYLLLGEDGAPFLDKNAIKAYSISGKSWVNNHVHILSPKIDFEFLQYSLNQIDYSEYVNGSTRLKLTQTDMCSIRLMLPPLSEQKLIKAKIQTLFSQLDMIMGSL